MQVLFAKFSTIDLIRLHTVSSKTILRIYKYMLLMNVFEYWILDWDLKTAAKTQKCAVGHRVDAK